MTEFQLELKHDPGDAQAYTYLGDIALHRNDYSSAQSLLNRATGLQRNIRLAYFDLGVVYFDRKLYPAAIAACRQAEQLDPSQPDAHYRLGRTYMALGQKQKADRKIAKTKALHSKNDESLIAKISGNGSVSQ